MKILGIGVDIVQNKRIRNLINNKNFIKRTFGKNEVKLFKGSKKKIRSKLKALIKHKIIEVLKWVRPLSIKM